MHEQYKTRCAEHGMTYEVWSSSTSSSTPPRNILVTIESTDSASFHEYLHILITSGRLARIIVDEAHLAMLHDSFRPIMLTLIWAGKQNVQVVLQSATCPPHLVPELFAKFGISQYTICRGKTCRPNVSYNVIRTKVSDMEDRLDRLHAYALSQSTTNQVLIFCRSKEIAEETAQRLNVPFCHANMSAEATEYLLGQFRRAEVRTIVATPILGVALDVPDVDWVIHFDYPYNMMGYIQEAGRAGRKNGSIAFSFVIAPIDGWLPKDPDPDRFGTRLIRDSLNNEALCRRWMMQMFNDGVGEPCSMMDGVSHFCDNCRRVSHALPERGAPNEFSLDMVNPYLPVAPG